MSIENTPPGSGEPYSRRGPTAARTLLAMSLGVAVLTASGATTAAAAGPAQPGESVAAASAPAEGLRAEYLFDRESGTAVPNSVGGGVGDATVVNGRDAHWTGSSLTLTGGPKSSTSANWVRLPDRILGDAESATVTIETRLDASMKSNWNFLWNIGSESTSQYYFASVRDNARTAITTNGNGGEVSARAASALSAERWYSLTSVIDGEAGTISFYVDGEQVASAATASTPASIVDQSLNTIGRAPYADPLYRGEVSTFRVYDRALSGSEVAAVSSADALRHAAEHERAARGVVDGIADLTLDDRSTRLPDYGGQVRWASDTAELTIAADGRTATAEQPAAGGAPVATTVTATATVRGLTATREVPVTILPAADADDPYGYAMVHFVEDSDGYAEKIYLDVSRGNDPEQWDPLNGGEPVLASDLGTTGIRDPFLTYNPETGTYYIIATDLRVFGGDRGVPGCTEWCYWSSQGSTKLNVWESTDLVTWSDLRQFDVATDPEGTRLAELGMAWAPEATWVDDYYDDGSGAFVLYWSSNLYSGADRSEPTYSRVLWGATPDFTQETYEYGGVFIDEGGNTIDTTLVQNDGTTYRVTKDNSQGRGLYMESTDAADWWEPTTQWTLIQERIGAVWSGGNPGGVEGPAVFKRHGEDLWYLYVDVIPTVGYRPMVSTDLDAGWSQLISEEFYLAPSTKHGGIIPLTKGLYDTLRGADAAEAVDADLGSVEVPADAGATAVRDALPAAAEVELAYGRGVSTRPVDWDLSSVELGSPGSYAVSGTVRTIGANLNQWVGAGGSTAWNAPDRRLFSSTAITVTAEVVIAVAEAGPLVAVAAETRCTAGRVTVVVRTTNTSGSPVALTVESAAGSRAVESLAAGRSTSVAFSTRQAVIGEGTVSVTATDEHGGRQVVTASHPAADCR